MKKILITLLIAVLCLPFVACTDVNGPAEDTSEDTVADSGDVVEDTDPVAEDTLPPAPVVDDGSVFAEDVYPNATPDTNLDDYEWIG